MDVNFNEIKHMFKLDPNKYISDEDLEKICESGTDCIIVGGTDNVKLDDVLNLLARVRRHVVPIILEISNLSSVTPGFDYYFIPVVLNSTETKWVTGYHQQAIKEFRHFINWDNMLAEGYIMLNPESKAYQYTQAKSCDDDDVVAYAEFASKLLHLPFVYLEYSGTYGDTHLVKKVAEVLDDSLLIYGGGINSKEKAQEMAEIADIIVVGNVIYEDLKAALKTVRAVKRVDAK